MPDYDVHGYRDGDEAKLVELLDSVFHGWPKLDINCSKQQYWRWKYLENPIQLLNQVIIEHQGEPVAYAGRLPRNIKINHSNITANQGADVVTHPDHRGQGLWNKVRDTLDQNNRELGVEFTYYITGNPIIVNKFNASPKHHRVPLPLQPMIRIEDIEKQLEAMPMDHPQLVKMGYKGIKGLQRLQHPHQEATGTVEPIDGFDERFDRLYKKTAQRYDFIIEKKPNYLEWRYSRSVADYEIRGIMKDGELAGFTVLLTNGYNPDYPIGFIVELLTLPGDTDTMNTLLSDAVDHFNKQQVNMTQLLSSHEQLNRVAKANGFVDAPFKMHVFFISTRPGLDEMLRNVENAYFSWGDHDSLPVSLPKAR